jgi:hypothetical protein
LWNIYLAQLTKLQFRGDNTSNKSWLMFFIWSVFSGLDSLARQLSNILTGLDELSASTQSVMRLLDHILVMISSLFSDGRKVLYRPIFKSRLSKYLLESKCFMISKEISLMGLFLRYFSLLSLRLQQVNHFWAVKNFRPWCIAFSPFCTTRVRWFDSRASRRWQLPSKRRKTILVLYLPTTSISQITIFNSPA